MAQVSKIFWQQTIEGQTVEFNNTPFVVSEAVSWTQWTTSLESMITLSRNSQWALVVFTSRVHVRLAAKHISAQLWCSPTHLSQDEASLGSRN